MGHAWVEIKVSNAEKEKSASVKAIADTGALLTVTPKNLANQLRIKTIEEELVATGTGPIKVKKGRARIKVSDREELFRVWISDIVDKVLLGAIVLEEHGFQADPATRELKKEPLLMY
ncbi:aspartyl protease [Candidatus Woesearchaeota archaeon]|nr:aspartyl protease [Candidatus Woesearchaeota archaeon]